MSGHRGEDERLEELRLQIAAERVRQEQLGARLDAEALERARAELRDQETRLRQAMARLLNAGPDASTMVAQAQHLQEGADRFNLTAKKSSPGIGSKIWSGIKSFGSWLWSKTIGALINALSTKKEVEHRHNRADESAYAEQPEVPRQVDAQHHQAELMSQQSVRVSQEADVSQAPPITTQAESDARNAQMREKYHIKAKKPRGEKLRQLEGSSETMASSAADFAASAKALREQTEAEAKRPWYRPW